MPDIVERLRALSRHEHDDLSIGDEAADIIEVHRNSIDALIAGWNKDRAERDEAISAARHLKNLVTSPLTEEDKEWARETMSDTNLARMPRDLATILRTEARNQRTPPIDYAVAEDGGRMVARPEPDIAMAELLEEAAARIAELEAALERIANVVGEDEPSIMWPWAQEIARSALQPAASEGRQQAHESGS
jgi:hypothetical protein